MWHELFKEVVKEAEYVYDRVVRRWGNPHFAQSTLYEWIWSERFDEYSAHLSPTQQGALRLALMKHFRIKPWPWSPVTPAQNAPCAKPNHISDLSKGNQNRGIL
jgi:hypothetical protein